MTTFGYLQKAIIQIGKERGYVTPADVERFYARDDIALVMNKLVLQGFFKEELDMSLTKRWIYIGEKDV